MKHEANSSSSIGIQQAVVRIVVVSVVDLVERVVVHLLDIVVGFVEVVEIDVEVVIIPTVVEEIVRV
ncbi:hypothetical protein Tco_0313520 [Tanacetum coccineum]